MCNTSLINLKLNNVSLPDYVWMPAAHEDVPTLVAILLMIIGGCGSSHPVVSSLGLVRGCHLHHGCKSNNSYYNVSM